MNPNKAQELLATFRRLRPSFEVATTALAQHVTEFIQKAGVPVLDIGMRTKDLESLEGKLQMKRADQYDELQDITDLSGVCVVVYFEDDIKQLVTLLSTAFTGLQREDLVDKLGVVDADRFGYRAHHLTVILSENLAGLDQKHIEAIVGYKGEIQIRTAFMHAWAKIEHKYNYKASIGSPAVKRGFARLASLVELADKELDAIHQWFSENEESIISAASVSAAISGNENQAILRGLSKEHHVIKNLGSSEIELELTQSLLQSTGFSDIRVVKSELLARQHTIVRAMNRYYAMGVEIRPQNALDFLAFDEAINKKQIAGLVELVQESVPTDDNFDMLDYCRRLYTAFTDH